MNDRLAHAKRVLAYAQEKTKVVTEREQQKLDLLRNLRWAWQLTDANAAQATDLLTADVAGRDLFKRAQYEAARRRVQL